MMKKNYLLIRFGFLCGFVTGLVFQMSSTAFAASADGFERMTFTVSASKTDYLPLEPIILTCRFSNDTETSHSTLVPNFLQDSRLRISFEGNIQVFDSISAFRTLSMRNRADFRPQSFIEENIALESNLMDFFPNEGTYKIQLLLTGPEGKELVSDWLELTVKQPTGIDKDALEFILEKNSYSRFSMPFFWDKTVTNERGETILEEFVRRFDESAYGEYASLVLGFSYLLDGQRAKASVRFEKLRSSQNSYILQTLEKSVPQNRLNPAPAAEPINKR